MIALATAFAVAWLAPPFVRSEDAGAAAKNEGLPPDLKPYMAAQPVVRRALVIGINNYSHLSGIPSARHDAETFSAKLQKLGFEVTIAVKPEELTAQALWDRIRRFQRSLEPGNLALLYYSGHGFQHRGLNYLAPSDTPKPLSPSELTQLVIPLDNIIQRLNERQAGFSAIILDACRTNDVSIEEPTGIDKSPGTGGFADVTNVPPQLIIGFAAEFGGVAAGNVSASENSLYTRHLNQRIDGAGQEFLEILRAVAREVNLDRPSQRPEFRVTVAGHFYPNPDARAAALEEATWIESLSSKSYRLVKAYLYDWPISRYAAMARKWLEDNPGAIAVADGTAIVNRGGAAIARQGTSTLLDAGSRVAYTSGSVRWYEMPGPIAALPSEEGAGLSLKEVDTPDFWEISDGSLLVPGSWWGTRVHSVVKAERVALKAEPRDDSRTVLELEKGDDVLVLTWLPTLLTGGFWTKQLDPETTWVSVQAIDPRGASMTGFVRGAFTVRRARDQWQVVAGIELVRAGVDEVLNATPTIRRVVLQKGAGFRAVDLPETHAPITLDRLREFPVLGKDLGDLGSSLIEVRVAASPLTGPLSQELPQSAQLLRALRIRAALIVAGARPENINIGTGMLSLGMAQRGDFLITSPGASREESITIFRRRAAP